MEPKPCWSTAYWSIFPKRNWYPHQAWPDMKAAIPSVPGGLPGISICAATGRPNLFPEKA